MNNRQAGNISNNNNKKNKRSDLCSISMFDFALSLSIENKRKFIFGMNKMWIKSDEISRKMKEYFWMKFESYKKNYYRITFAFVELFVLSIEIS